MQLSPGKLSPLVLLWAPGTHPGPELPSALLPTLLLLLQSLSASSCTCLRCLGRKNQGKTFALNAYSYSQHDLGGQKKEGDV